MLMAMGHAAQNDAYLETVSGAVSAMLSDLDHPLMTDARNYVRLLWDQMEATRRLKQTEAHYTGAGVAYDVGRPSQTERRSSGSMVAAGKRPLPAELAPTVLLPEKPAAEAIETHQAQPIAGSRKATLLGVGEARPSTSSAPRQRVAAHPDSSSKITSSSAPETHSRPAHKAAALAEFAAPEVPAVGKPLPEAGPAEVRPTASMPREVFEPLTAEPRLAERKFESTPDEPRREIVTDDFKLPTRDVPRWAVGAVIAAALVGVGVVVVLTSESGQKSEAPAASASAKTGPQKASATASQLASALAPTRSAKSHESAAAAKSSQAPPPQVPPPVAPVPTTAKPTVAPTPATPPPKLNSARSQPVVSVPIQPKSAQSKNIPAVQAPKSAPAPKKSPDKSVEPAQQNTTGPVITSPEVSRTLSPLDRIIAELRIISPDPSGIEDKARELSRIIARAKRKEAHQIIEDLGPPVAVDPLGRDSTLEESLRTFAISVLGRVATDDDDNRAVDALLMLGEWVKGASKGKQKALAALESLSHDPTVKTSAPRLRALKSAQAQAE